MVVIKSMFLPITLVSLVVTLSNAADPECFNTSQLCNATDSCCHASESCLSPVSICAEKCTVDAKCSIEKQTCVSDTYCAFKCETTNNITNVTGNCSDGFICHVEEVNTVTGVCVVCANESQPCYNWSCCEGLTCDGTDISESNPGTCQVSCGTTGDNCTVKPDTCCDDYHCNGTNISESNPGTCQKKNKGFSLFDMSFSLKHLVGIEVVMVATWFL